ncbi:MAG TPA: DUF4157 domain-containing protein [Burkholderiaceae bacterium]|nr:DUF4157 domain-containing protein [Burkholderiaceae bacterium]
MSPAAGKMVLRAPAVMPVPPRVQAAPLAVSSPHDAAEREAVNVARRVVSMPAPAAAIVAPRRSPWVQRFAPHIAQRRGEGAPAVGAQTTTDISAARGGGAPLPTGVRSFMEPRFGADFASVRVHTDARAARAASQLQAQAFTVGGDIFFGRGRFQPESADGRELIAHELTHTLQQGAAVRRSADAPTVREQVTEPQVQRLGLRDALDYFADHAAHIPGFRMLTIVLGVNPINMRGVERSAANILRALVELIPGGHLITQALDNHGLFDRIAGWAGAQIAALGMVGASLRAAIDEFLGSLSWTDIFDLGGVWRRAMRIVTAPIDRLIAFGRALATQIIAFVRDAILRPLGRLAEGTRGYDLLRAVLGFDPVTGEAVARNATTLIGGFMRLIGQEEVWDNIQRGNAVGRAWAWFQGALADVTGFVREIPGLFVAALRALEWSDLVLVPRAFARLAGVFGGFVGRFMSWAGGTVMNLLEIVFSVVAPGVMVYIRRAAGAFTTIVRNPVGFVGHLVRAGMTGLRQFATNVLAHLRAALIGWLTGAMSGAGIYIPQAFSLVEIVKFVLSVLGLTWQAIRAKLVRAVGEPAVRAMEMGFDIVMTLVTQGPAAAWQRIVESLTNLREMVIEQVLTFVRERIVVAAITRLVSMLNPAGAFIQAIIATYNTVMFFVERLRQIAQVAAAVIDSIAAIAAGQIAAAANRVEQTMAGLLTLVISFLARLVGLGRVSDAVTNVINRVRQPIDRALDRVVDWLVAQARRLGRFVAQAGVPNDPGERLRLASRASIAIAARLPRSGLTAPIIARAHDAIKLRYGLTELTPYQQGGAWYVRAVVNPPLVWRLPLPGETAGTGGIGAVAVDVGPGGEVTAGVRGELRPGIPRRGSEASLPLASDLPDSAFSYLRGYRRAHVYGPGFGDETAIGLMYASEQVNNELQSRGSKFGIEGYARRVRERVTALGGRVAVEVVATSFRDPPPGVPQPLNVPVLRSVTYTFVVVDAQGEELRYQGTRATASITCAPPLPNGAGGQGEAQVVRLAALDDYLGSRSRRTGL